MLNLLRHISFSLLFYILIISCSEREENKYLNEDNLDDTYLFDENSENKFEDGGHSATVEYYNPNTGYSGTYTQDVEIQDGKIVAIYFPNDGYLDESHIDETEIDEYGRATIIDDEGREFEIEVE